MRIDWDTVGRIVERVCADELDGSRCTRASASPTCASGSSRRSRPPSRGRPGWSTTAPLFASTATTDARSFALYGDTPAVCFGPLGEHAHGVDERVHLPTVTTTAQAIALFVADWCGLSRL